MRPRYAVRALAVAAGLSGFIFLVLARPARVAGPPAHEHDAGMNMTVAEMEAWSKSYWASHPRVGRDSKQLGAATFTVDNFFFDLDGNPATGVDTAKIFVGESVMWQWVNGTHTITNGTGASDPAAGTLFNQPSTSSSTQFSFAFNNPGTFPFFCRPHEGAMKGIVIVSSNVGVDPSGGTALGFTRAPSPNPARLGVSFEFVLREAGRTRADVFDAGGRRVATVIDRDLAAGPQTATWDGREASGRRAGPGLYWLRLKVPGYESSRAIVIAR